MKGEGNQLDFGARIYDPRIGKFLSVDPLTGDFADQSPYGFAANSPLLLVDAMGLSPEFGDPPTKTRAKTYIRVRTYREVPNPSGNNIRNTPRVSRWSGMFKTVSTLGGATFVWSWISKPANADYAGPGASDGKETSFRDIEIFTDDPSTLQDGYLGLVKSRILDGTAKASDWRYTEELHKRGILSRSESEGKLASMPLPSDLPEYVYRFDTRSPEEIKAAGGFEAWEVT